MEEVGERGGAALEGGEGAGGGLVFNSCKTQYHPCSD